MTTTDPATYRREILESCALVKTKDAATILGCTPRTVVSYMHDGKLTPYSFSGRVGVSGLRFLVSEVRAFAATRR